MYKKATGSYPILMAFPSKEEFALSSLGYLWLYKTADTTEGIQAIRCSTDNIFYPKNLGSIAFSMSFDFDFMGVFKILEELNIPFCKRDRDKNSPLIFAGGPVITTNPRPYDDIFDFMLIGDGEACFAKVLEIIKNNNKIEALELIQNIQQETFILYFERLFLRLK